MTEDLRAFTRALFTDPEASASTETDPDLDPDDLRAAVRRPFATPANKETP